MVTISPPLITDFGGETGLKSPISDFPYKLFYKFCSEFFKGSYLSQFLGYNNVKDTFGKLILSTFPWLQFHCR